MSDYKEDGKGAKSEGKAVYMSSPRRRLQQVKLQAKAMDEENARIDAHHITQDITKNFVHDVICDSVEFLSADKKK